MVENVAEKSSGAPKLPSELVDIILDFLYDDKETLASCSLVSSEWTLSSRFHLFNRVLIVGATAADFQAFEHFLEEHPNIASFIRHLHLVEMDVDVESDETQICSHILKSILSKLPRLDILELQDVRFYGGACEKLGHFHAPSSVELEELVIHSVGDEKQVSIRDLLHIFNIFSTLRRLHVEDIMWDAELGHDVTSGEVARALSSLESEIPSQLAIRSLSIRESWATLLLCQLLRKTASVHTLESINVLCSSPEEVIVLGALIADAAPNILHFEFNINLTTLHYWQRLNLTSCMALQSVVLSTELVEDGEDNWNLALCQSMADMLSSISSPVCHITLRFDIYGTALRLLDRSLDWRNIDQIATGFAHLKNFTIILNVSDVRQAWNIIAQCGNRLHRLCSRGLLRVQENLLPSDD